MATADEITIKRAMDEGLLAGIAEQFSRTLQLPLLNSLWRAEWRHYVRVAWAAHDARLLRQLHCVIDTEELQTAREAGRDHPWL